jgi:hypothetical protein
MTTQQTEPLVLPTVTWGYTPDTGQLMAQCGEHEAQIHKDPKTGQSAFHLTLTLRRVGSPRTKEVRSRPSVAQMQQLSIPLRLILEECRDGGLLRTPSPVLRNGLCLLALLEALVEHGRRGR